jgi:MFS superfamily sulfate permease-like transporter
MTEPDRSPPPETNRLSVRDSVARVFPFVRWFDHYGPAGVQADFISGLTVALVLIPQSMAYAQLADLPAYYGLYAAFLPPMVAAMFGSSHQLATGPVAIVSLMTATALAPLATAGSDAFIAYAILLALLVGLFQFSLGVLRLGMIVNFLSHPVVNGFTNAAAIIIATSQLPKLFGVEIDKAPHHYETVWRTLEAAWHSTHWPTLALGALAIVVMAVLKRINPRIPYVLCAVVLTTLISWGIGLDRNEVTNLDRLHAARFAQVVARFNANLQAVDEAIAQRITMKQNLKQAVRTHGKQSLEAIGLRARVAESNVRVAELRETSGNLRGQLRAFRFARVVESDGSVAFHAPDAASAGADIRSLPWRLVVKNKPLDPEALTLMGGGAVVGTIPRGLPTIAVPRLDLGIMRDLLSMAVIISLLGFMEAISIAKAMANRTGQRLDANQELIGQGLANIVGACALSYPVSGSFSRSAVNIQAGAVTGMSSVFSSLVVVATLLFFTPLLYHLPQSVLAAIIMMAVIGLVNVKGFLHAWQAQKYDGVIAVVSFVCTLAFAPHLDKGILIGVALSLAVYLFRNMKPRTAILSRSRDGSFRNADRWGLETCRHVAVIRFNNSIIFANVNHLETEVLRAVACLPELKHVIMVGNGINELDSSGEVMLSFLIIKLRTQGIDVSFSGLNEHVIDVMKRTHLYERIGEDHFYVNVTQAVQVIHKGACVGNPDNDCPLLHVRSMDN